MDHNNIGTGKALARSFKLKETGPSSESRCHLSKEGVSFVNRFGLAKVFLIPPRHCSHLPIHARKCSKEPRMKGTKDLRVRRATLFGASARESRNQASITAASHGQCASFLLDKIYLRFQHIDHIYIIQSHARPTWHVEQQRWWTGLQWEPWKSWKPKRKWTGTWRSRKRWETWP